MEEGIILLDGLKYIHTYSVVEFKEYLGIARIDVKINPHSELLYFEYGDNKGEVATINIPDNPVVSVVTNISGQLFFLLHEFKDVGKISFTREKYTKGKASQKKQSRIQHNKTSFSDYENAKMNEDWSDPYGDIQAENKGWSQDEIDNGLADTFEGDYSAYDRW